MGNNNMGNSKVVVLFLFYGSENTGNNKYKRLNYLFKVESVLSLSSWLKGTYSTQILIDTKNQNRT